MLDAHLAHLDRHNRALNAVVTLDSERARDRARLADEALAGGDVWGRLHGVPFTLKDAFATAGVRTTVGFPPLDHIPTADSTVAARLKAAGAVLMGKTNVASLLADYQTDNPIFGRTNNPWDVDRTPGGSSGGAAAAVAAGITPFDIGTDLSGSIRIPAHFCGLFGMKPTEHRVSLAGVVPDPRGAPRSVRIMSAIGPLARSLEDVALLFELTAGSDDGDVDVPPVPVDGMPNVSLSKLRIACAPTFPGIPASDAARNAVEQVADELRRRGAVVEAALPELDVNEELSNAGQLIGLMIGAFQDEGGSQAPSLAEYMRALHRRDQSIVAWERFFERWDALLCSPCMTTAFTHCEQGTPITVDGRRTDYWMVSAHTTPFNYSGHPALVLPWSRDGAGLPLGVQLVGRRWGEARLLGIAAAMTEVTGGFRRPPGY